MLAHALLVAEPHAATADGEAEASRGVICQLRSHPEACVVAAVLATYRQLLLGAHTSSAAASVLLQGMLQELRQLIGTLPPSNRTMRPSNSANPPGCSRCSRPRNLRRQTL